MIRWTKALRWVWMALWIGVVVAHGFEVGDYEEQCTAAASALERGRIEEALKLWENALGYPDDFNPNAPGAPALCLVVARHLYVRLADIPDEPGRWEECKRIAWYLFQAKRHGNTDTHRQAEDLIADFNEGEEGDCYQEALVELQKERRNRRVASDMEAKTNAEAECTRLRAELDSVLKKQEVLEGENARLQADLLAEEKAFTQEQSKRFLLEKQVAEDSKEGEAEWSQEKANYETRFNQLRQELQQRKAEIVQERAKSEQLAANLAKEKTEWRQEKTSLEAKNTQLQGEVSRLEGELRQLKAKEKDKNVPKLLVRARIGGLNIKGAKLTFAGREWDLPATISLQSNGRYKEGYVSCRYRGTWYLGRLKPFQANWAGKKVATVELDVDDFADLFASDEDDFDDFDLDAFLAD